MIKYHIQAIVFLQLKCILTGYSSQNSHNNFNTFEQNIGIRRQQVSRTRFVIGSKHFCCN